MIDNIISRHTRLCKILHESLDVHGADVMQGHVQDKQEGQEKSEHVLIKDQYSLSEALPKALEAKGSVTASASET